MRDTRLTRVRELLPTNTDLRQALRELEDAEDKIARACKFCRALEQGSSHSG